MGLSEGEESEKRTEETFEAIVTENFSKLKLHIKPQIQESQKMPCGINISFWFYFVFP